MPDGGWYGLLALEQEMRDTIAEERSREPVACPLCGEPLQSGPRGELHCRFDGFLAR